MTKVIGRGTALVHNYVQCGTCPSIIFSREDNERNTRGSRRSTRVAFKAVLVGLTDVSPVPVLNIRICRAVKYVL